MARHLQRRDRLRRLIRHSGADAILITNETNVTYLTGFTGDDSLLLVTPADAIVLSDPRYAQQLGEQCPDVDAAIRPPGTELMDTVMKVIRAAKIGRLAIEAASMTVAFWSELSDKLPKLEIVSTVNLVEQLRQIKDREEIAEIREAIKIAEKAFAVVRASLRPERTEREVAYELEHQIRLFGGTGCSFTPIVGAGPRAALPHAVLSDHRIGESPFVLIDWGARGRLYVSDLTRILITGTISPKLERLYGLVREAQAVAIAAIRPGARLKDVDAAARKVIEDAGFGRRFGHGLGHGIGLEVHEGPRLAANQEGELKPGMVVTVEPGVYLPGWGGIRIEDDVLVRRTGHEVLSTVPKELDQCVLS